MVAKPQEKRPRKERKENADMRRGQIIEATFRSIVRNGLSGTTLASVSNEAGLSQGVAVFYFQNKQSLLGAALQAQYELYQRVWQRELAAAGEDAVSQIAALVRADFHGEICNADSLTIWHAFWGEASARPLYGSISTSFEEKRAIAMRQACAKLLRHDGRSEAEAEDIAAGIDAMTDGLWLSMYLGDQKPDLSQPMRLAALYLGSAFPAHAEDFRRELHVA